MESKLQGSVMEITPTAMKNAERRALCSLAHSAQLKRKIEKAQLFNLYL